MSARRTKRSTKRRAEERVPHSAPGQAEEIERLKRENDQLRDKLAERDRQIADLERQLALRQQNSTTTSKPPSSDGLAGRQRERGRTTSRRKVGGQPGHPGHCRPLVALDRVQERVDVFP